VPREFSGARLCAEHQPQQGGNSNRDALRLGLRPQPRSVLVAALPRWAVSQVLNLRTVAREQRSADSKSAIRQITNLRYVEHVRDFCHATDFEVWCLGFGTSLELGVWSLVLGVWDFALGSS
jgi:hypothetical protein